VVAGQLSPDGMWRWDGQRWVPSGLPPPSGPRRSNRWLWGLAGGCAVVLVIGIAGGVYGMVSLIHAVQNGSLGCLPSDFPRYPSATETGFHTYIGTNAAPGDNQECKESFSSNDDVAAVTDFYTGRLGSGDWRITSNDTANGTIAFSRVSRSQTVGTIGLLGRGQHTIIEITLDY
jgi:hypothetical protein